jgi:predicted unusual protein kinase regulating ubiquinone biosynthesis (AarF/ABC1/UbiB family)
MVPRTSKQKPLSTSRNPETSSSSTEKPRLVMYDFGQASTLTRNQADGILEIIEAIIDTDVDRSIKAFQKMGVLVDGADLDLVRKKVAENYR